MATQDKEKNLIKNTGILAIGTLCSKLFSFLLLPLYTTVLSTEDYGVVDVLQSVTSFLLPFVGLQLSSAMFRFIIEKEKDRDKKVIISTGICLEALNVIAFSILVLILNQFIHIEYCGLFILYFSAFAGLEIAQNITRGFGNNALYSFMSFVMTAVSVVANLIMILLLGMKGDSILIASSISYIVVLIIAVFRQKLWKFFSIKSFSKQELKPMLKYCLPLIPNSVSWWVANTSDRLLIRFFINAGANGIYAAANKIPTIYTTIFNVYNIAWTEALSRSAGDSDHEDFINNMFKKSIRLFGCVCVGLICCIGLIFEFLIGKDYRGAYIHTYILITAIFVNSLCSILGGIFTAFKKSSVIGSTTVYGAIVNFVVNILLIKYIGLYAASISTLISYIVIFVLRLIGANRLISLKWPKKYLAELIIMFIITSVCYLYKNKLLLVINLILLIIWSVYSNRELISQILGSAFKKVREKFGR